MAEAVGEQALLRLFHEQVRLADRDHPADRVVEHDGPIHRVYPPDPAEPGAMIESPEGLGPDPDAAIARQVDFFTARGQSVEWKTYAYDEPADLRERLAAYGFVAGPEETLVLGRAERLAEPVSLPGPYAVRALAHRDGSDSAVPEGRRSEWDQIAALDEAAFGEAAVQWSRALRAEEEDDPAHVRSVVAVHRDSGDIVGHGVLRLVPGTAFAGLWGGKVHPGHRGQGLYRAMTALRARWALDAGHGVCRVDALPTSRPILERMGMAQVTTTTPCLLSLPLTHPLTGEGRSGAGEE